MSAPSETPPPIGWVAEATALFLKDLRAELRTKVAVSAVGVFTFASLMLLALATATLKELRAVNILRLADGMSRAQIESQMFFAWDDTSKMGFLWILLCFAAFTGLAHSFVHEEEAGTVLALRLSMSSGAVYAGKLAFNLALILSVAVLVTPAYMLIVGMSFGSPLVFLSVMFSGCVGLAGAATILAAIAAKARGTGALYGALGLPMLFVFLMLLLNAARAVFVQTSGVVTVQYVGGLLSYGILLIAVSVLIFRFVWEE